MPLLRIGDGYWLMDTQERVDAVSDLGMEFRGIRRMLEDFSSVNRLCYVFLFRRKVNIDITKLN